MFYVLWKKKDKFVLLVSIKAVKATGCVEFWSGRIHQVPSRRISPSIKKKWISQEWDQKVMPSVLLYCSQEIRKNSITTPYLLARKPVLYMAPNWSINFINPDSFNDIDLLPTSGSLSILRYARQVKLNLTIRCGERLRKSPVDTGQDGNLEKKKSIQESQSREDS